MVRESRRWMVVALGAALLSLGAGGREDLVARGERLFRGDAPLTATMTGHTQVLPREAVRCVNCHDLATDPPRAPTENFGPRLGKRSLVQNSPRRGGPPSRYDLARFCKLLRDGTDPAYVMIPQTMPRYTLDDAECEALWAFLVSR